MKVQWTVPAIDDLESIRTYIARDSDFYAVRFVEKIIDTVENLTVYSEIGRVVPEAEDPRIREIIFQNFRIMTISKTIPFKLSPSYEAPEILAIGH